jgi:hypothetical protein
MHHGRIWFESEGIPGRGSVFSFTLPVYGAEGEVDKSGEADSLIEQPVGSESMSNPQDVNTLQGAATEGDEAEWVMK